MTHTVDVSDAIWNWARKQGRSGPATYIRDILTAHALSNGGEGEETSSPARVVTEATAAVINRGIRSTAYIHLACYEKLVDQAEDVSSIPEATPFEAQFTKPCPVCKRMVNAGDPAVAIDRSALNL